MRIRRTEPPSNMDLFMDAFEHCNLGKEALREGQFTQAIDHLRKASAAAESLLCRAAGNKIPKIGD